MPRLEDISIHGWIIQNQICNEKREAINFTNHPFLFDVYRDFSPNQVCLKAAQIGFSTTEILKTFFVCKKLGLDLIYTLPTDDDASVFVSGKVNRMIANNPVLQEYTIDKDTVEQKKIGNAMAYFRGTFTKRKAISVSADVLIHDEEDFSDQEILADYDSRLQHSKYKWNWHFGHPSTDGVGVSRYWAKSDQKHWFIKCEHCGEDQYLKWPDSINFEIKQFVCRSCRKQISDDTRRDGRWVQKFKDKPYSGYWISLLMAPWINAEYIIEKSTIHTDEYFYNRVLGLPFIGSGNKVYEEDILGNLVENEINDQRDPVVIGLDTGIRLHYVVGNDLGLFFYGEAKEYNEIEALLKRFPKAILVADQGGDLIGIRQLQEKYRGRVFLCYYRADRKTMQLIQWGEREEHDKVIVDRNRTMQLLIDEFKQKRIPIFGNKKDWWDYWLHWNNIYRICEEDSNLVERYKWLRSGADHWCHATLYWRVGLSKFIHGQGKVFGAGVRIKTSPEVLSDQKIKYNPLTDRTINIDCID